MTQRFSSNSMQNFESFIKECWMQTGVPLRQVAPRIDTKADPPSFTCLRVV